MADQIFLNLPVKNLQKSMNFFEQAGFQFNKQFTDDKAACLVLGENMFAMLLVEEFFATFTKKEIANAKKTTEVLLGLGVESRKKVDQIIESGIAAGGKESRELQDHGWMYGRALEDLDGHIWEFFFMER